MRQMLLLLVPTAALMAVLSDPITQVVYQRGAVRRRRRRTWSRARSSTSSFSLPFAGVNLILIRTFFSLQRPWTPTALALGNLGQRGARPLLYKPMGIGGIALDRRSSRWSRRSRQALVLRRDSAGSTAPARSTLALRISLAAAAILARSRSGSGSVLDAVLAAR